MSWSLLPRQLMSTVMAAALAAALAGCGVAAARAGSSGAARSAGPPSAPAAPIAAGATPAGGAAQPTPPPASAAQAIDATLSEYSIYLSQTEAKPGVVRFTVTNTGQRKHNLRVAGNGVDEKTVDLGPGQSAVLEVRFVDPGPFTVYCDLADHADRGMTQTLSIEP